MYTWSRVAARPVHRTAIILAALGILFLAGALAGWRGTPPAVVIPAMAVVLGIALVVGAVAAARRALRRASDQIDTILREELAPVGPDDRSPLARADAFSLPPGLRR
ncbi:hypothetical protein [Actinophytocola sp.]|uniref:hypothetical protein n=1 Tax=Actinophytocola sp. TaxID=1872138 RepID=UPI003D6B0AA1